jgi:hypothetical protein
LTLTFVDPVPREIDAQTHVDFVIPKRLARSKRSTSDFDPPSALRGLIGQIDALPDSHPVRLCVVAYLIGGVHRTTVWRWVKERRLPSPTMIANVPTFPLGLIRKIQREGLPPKQAERSLRTGG